MKILSFILLTISSLYSSINLDTKQYKIYNTTEDKTTIKATALIAGQSGVIIRTIDKKNSIIISYATVISSSASQTTLSIDLDKSILKQDALPTFKSKVKDGDTFILNHLYSSSLLIVPNFETSQYIKEKYPKQNFLNPDIFASYLKINDQPTPSQTDIQTFCTKQDIGTIYIVIAQKLYILDVNSFTTINTLEISDSQKDSQSPFFTKVKDIEQGFWDFSQSEIKDYDKYYSKILGLK